MPYLGRNRRRRIITAVKLRMIIRVVSMLLHFLF